MKLFIQIKVGQPLETDTDLLHYASSLADDLIGTEIESESDPRIADMVVKLALQVKKIFILVIVGDPSASAGNIAQVFSRLHETGKPVSVVLEGRHPGAEEICAQLKIKLTRANKSEEIKTQIIEFAQ